MLKVKKIILSFYSISLMILLFLAIFLFFQSQPAELKFYVFDIGQGDAIFIRTPDRFNILIDGGPDNTVVYKLGQYLPFYDREIDLMISTHPHADHIVGLIEVLERYKVKKILATGVLYSSPDYLAWLAKISKKNIPIEIADQPGIIFLGSEVKLDILFPDQSFLNKKVKNLNNTSIVAKLTYGPNSVLLTGDFEDEESLIAKIDLDAKILKVGHHGSDTANDLEFLKAVKPDLAIISCGENNRFGHPHQETLENLERLGIEILRTDLEGDFIYP
jgi:competence protein ComEC